MYNYGWFVLLFDRNQHNIVKIKKQEGKKIFSLSFTHPSSSCLVDSGLWIRGLNLKMHIPATFQHIRFKEHETEESRDNHRPFRYDLNQIPYNYTVEVRDRFKGLDLIDSLMNYGQRFVTLYRRQGSRPSPWKRNAKWQNSCLRRPYK